MKLRDYQIDIEDRIRTEYAKGRRRVLLQLGTGGGKTAIFTDITRRLAIRQKSALIITDREELHIQSGNTLARSGVSYREVTAKTREIKKEQSLVWVGMVETIKRRLARPDYAAFVQAFDMIIIDEAHKQVHNKIFEAITPSQMVLGATATPLRTGKMQLLKDYYDAIVCGPQNRFLIQEGHLVPPVNFGVPVDLSTAKITGGDYNEGDLGRIYADRKLFDGVIENWQEKAKGLKTIVYCATVDNSLEMVQEFEKIGVKACHIDGTTPKEERRRLFSEFRSGPYTVLCNVGVATTGTDIPEAECIVLYRATKSLILYLQMVGRGGRPCPEIGKTRFVLMDFGNNIRAHGFWDDDRTWILDPPKKKKKKVQEFPVKDCPNCGALLRATARLCDFCGYEFEAHQTEKERFIIRLQEMSPSDIARAAENATIDELETIRDARGYKVGYVMHRMKTMEDFLEYERIKKYKKGWALANGNRYLGIDKSWREWYGS